MLKESILAIMVAVAPPGRSTAETREAGLERYGEIAEAIDQAAETPLEVAILIAVGFHESGFRKDVDLGVKRGSGVDCGLWQVRVSRSECEGLVADRTAAARFALERVRRSLRSCRQLPEELRLAVYASGQCGRGWTESRAMMRPALQWLGRLHGSPAGALSAQGGTQGAPQPIGPS